MTKPDIGRRRVALGLLVVFVAVVTAAAALTVFAANLFQAEPHTFNGLSFDPPRPAPDFTLIDQHYQPVSMHDFRGKVVLLYFGFTHCPDACPATLGTWKRVYNLLGDDADQVCFVMITVDPERDTPETLARHLSLFNSEFIGLSGSLAETEDVAQDYNVFFQKVDVGSAAGYLVNHTTLTHVVDRQGQLVLGYPLYETDAQAIVADLEYLLD